MSFSAEVKAELLAVEDENECCLLAMAYGMLICGRSFGRSSICLQTDNKEIAEKYRELTIESSGIDPVIHCSSSEKYKASVNLKADRLMVLNAFGHDGTELTLRVNRGNFENECCMSAFLRGAFLSCGTLTDPNKDYHLEFVLPYMKLSEDLYLLMRELELNPKKTIRKGSHILYFKESESIEDILVRMGAQNGAFELMQVKVLKDVRNNINRKTNFETANISRTASAAAEQIFAIEKIIEIRGFESIPPELQEIAKLRLENPEMSLRELGEILSEPISRSGINHRLKRLQEIAKEI